MNGRQSNKATRHGGNHTGSNRVSATNVHTAYYRQGGDTKQSPIPIYNIDGTIVGKVADGEFFKSVSSKTGFLRQPPAIAFDVSSLDQAERAGAVRVVIKEKETGTIYRASLASIRQKGFPVNRGHGPQIALALDNWSKKVKGQPAQPALFGGDGWR